MYGIESPNPAPIEVLMNFLDDRHVTGFEGPTCLLAESRAIAYLQAISSLRSPRIEQITVSIYDMPDTQQYIEVLKKDSTFGESTYLCLTGDFAGCLAAKANKNKHHNNTWPSHTQSSIDAYIRRPLLATTDVIDLAYKKNIKPYITGRTLNVYEAAVELLDQMGVVYNPYVFEDNIVTFTDTYSTI